LTEVQRGARYQIRATVEHSGRYYHSGCMDVDAERDDGQDVNEEQYATIKQAMRDFADWIYKQLQAQDDWQRKDENVDEAITANDYEFTENGKMN